MGKDAEQEQYSLTELIESLDKPSKRAYFVFEMVGLRAIEERHVSEAITYFSKQDPMKAADLARKAGRSVEELRDLYDKGLDYMERQQEQQR